MFRRLISGLFFRLVSLCAVPIIGVTGCGDDDNDEQVGVSAEWVGPWVLTTVNGKSLEQILAEDTSPSEGGRF